MVGTDRGHSVVDVWLVQSAGRALKTGMTGKTGRTGKKKDGPDPALWPKALARVRPLAFRRAPLLAAACWFAVGEVLARSWQPAGVMLAVVAALFVLCVAGLRWSLRVAVVPLAALWIAVGFWCAEMQPVPSTQHILKGYADGLSREVRGRVVRVRELPPMKVDGDQDQETGWWDEKEEKEEAAAAGALSVDLEVQAVEDVTPDVSRMVPVDGGVRMDVIADGATGGLGSLGVSKVSYLWRKGKAGSGGVLPVLRCGDMVEAPMRMKVAELYRDPGAWQYADYLLAQGIGTHASVRASKVAVSDGGADGLRLWERAGVAAQVQCRIYAAQSWASGRVTGYVRSRANRGLPRLLRLGGDDAGMLNAMLFGDRAGLNRTQRVGFERTGSFHLFVVSGMHVGLLAGLVFWVARRLKLREWLGTLLTIVLTFGFALLTGFGAPVQRALFMTAVFLLARLLSRDRNVLNALGAAALGCWCGRRGRCSRRVFR